MKYLISQAHRGFTGLALLIVVFVVTGCGNQRPIPAQPTTNGSETEAPNLSQTSHQKHEDTSATNESPAETPTAVDPVDLKPEIEIAAKATWQHRGQLIKEGKIVPPNLRLRFYLTGKTAMSATAWGKLNLTMCTTNTGEALKVVSPQFDSQDLASNFFEIANKRVGPSLLRESFGQPQDGVLARIYVSHPTQPAEALARVEGSIALRGGSVTETLHIRNIRSLVGSEIQNPAIMAAGLSLKVRRQTPGLIWIDVANGDPNRIKQIIAVDGNGKQHSDIYAMRDSAGPGEDVAYALEAFATNEVPADVGLKLTIVKDIQTTSVPFEFSNLPIPLPPNHPGKPPVSIEGIPEGLTLGCKTYCTFGTLWTEIQIKGPQAENAISWGKVTITKAIANSGIALQANEPDPNVIPQPPDPRTTYATVERGRSSPHPDGAIQATIPWDMPMEPIREIVELEGTLKLKSAKELKTIEIKNALRLAGRRQVFNSELKAAGVLMRISKISGGLRIDLPSGGDAVTKIEAVDENGELLRNVGAQRLDSVKKGAAYSVVFRNEIAPAGLSLRVSLAEAIDDLEIPFHFQNVPVPEPEIGQ